MAALAHKTNPAAEMNMTPMIDVLLVLLVLFVITIPPATHSLDIDLPQDCPRCAVPRLESDSNRLVLDSSDRLLWNGTAIELATLAELLRASRRMPVEPELQFAPEALASYAASARTLTLIKASGVTKFGFVGNERFRHF